MNSSYLTSIRRCAAAFALVAFGLPAAHAAFSTSDSGFGQSTLILDGQSGMQWLKLDATMGLSFDAVESQLDAGETFAGFAIATIEQVDTLFKDGGVYAPLSPLTTAQGLAAGAAFGAYFGGYNTGSSFLSQGMTANRLLFQQQTAGVGYRAGVSTGSFDDAYSGRAGGFGVGTWLVRTVSPVPEPATLWLMAIGLAALAGARHLRRRAR